MISGNTEKFNTPIRTIAAMVRATHSSPLAANPIDIRYDGDLKEVEINRTGAKKFFGYGVAHKSTIKLLDTERNYNFNAASSFQIFFDDVKVTPPLFYEEAQRDEKTNELTVTAYDALQSATQRTVAELGLEGTYTPLEFARACAGLLGLSTTIVLTDSGADTSAFYTSYVEGANFDGTETIREALNAVAEVTQTIYYINANNYLVFKRLSTLEAVTTIDKAKYFSLDSKDSKAISGICSVTELGDNVQADNGGAGVIQYVRDNPFWELREDLSQLVTSSVENVSGLAAAPFYCSWRGNYLIEPADKIAFITKDNNVIYSYLINDTISYKGGFSQVSEWDYAEEEASAANPATLGDKLKQTYARVDKQAKQIDIVASEATATKALVAELQVTTSEINASVSNVEKLATDALDDVRGDITSLTTRVNATMTDSQVRYEIQKELDNGVSKVETNTGFTFDDTGLTVSKSNSEMTTTITEDGMKVFKNNTEMLTANNKGVFAVDLHASSYLIIGNNSRFEDMGGDRTACFWIGG